MTDKPKPKPHEEAFRRNTEAAVLVAVVGNVEHWRGDSRTAGQIAVELTDELIEALRRPTDA